MNSRLPEVCDISFVMTFFLCELTVGLHFLESIFNLKGLVVDRKCDSNVVITLTSQ
jgi:hypothetical protein